MTQVAAETQALIPGKRALRSFVLRFAAIAVLLALVPFVPGWDGLLKSYLVCLAALVNGFLHLLGEPTRLHENIVASNMYKVTLAPNCAALEAAFFYSAALLAFPAPPVRKLVGVVIGFVGIAAMNLLRVVTVFLAGVYWPSKVTALHEGLWPVLMIMGTVGLCAAWLCWAGGRRAA